MRLLHPRTLTAFSACAGLTCLVAVISLAAETATVRRESADPSASRHARGRVQSGRELVAVFFAASTCPGASNRHLPAAVKRINRELQTRAVREGKRFVAIGISADENAEVGISFL